MDTLAMGTFPKNVASYETSLDPFFKLVHVDHQIHALVHQYIPGQLYAQKRIQLNEEALVTIESLKTRLTLLDPLDSRKSIESLYQAVLLGHLYNLEGNTRASNDALESHCRIRIPKSSFPEENRFLDYLRARLCCLLGSASPDNYTHWIVYVVEFRQMYRKSDIALKMWTHAIFDNVLSTITAYGQKPLSFQDVKAQRFAENTPALIVFCNHCLKPRNAHNLSRNFALEYSPFLTELVQNSSKSRAEFPSANQERPVDLDLMDAIYGSLDEISTSREYVTKFLKKKTLKKYLISMAERSFQDRQVLANLINTLIDLKEYDEAFAAFETYVEYVHQEKVKTDGNIMDLLSVIDTYTAAITAFNPLNSFIPDSKLLLKKFNYRFSDEVVLALRKYSLELHALLDRALNSAGLTYGGEIDEEEVVDENLSFLYYRFNDNAFIDDASPLGNILCSAWFAMGKFSSYLATYESNSVDDMEENTKKMKLFYKLGLILNCTRSVSFLFEYALSLAYSSKLESTVKLCKFILKRHPESFKTWNLLVLALSGLENQLKTIDDLECSAAAPADILPKSLTGEMTGDGQISTQNGVNAMSNGHVSNGQANGHVPNGHVSNGHASNGGISPKKAPGLEKFVDDALNVAALYLNKNRENDITTPIEVRYDILQLKMTQLAIWESNHGVDYILNYIADLFVLYKELFLDFSLPKDVEAQNKFESRSVGVWSHRPSVIDPSERVQALQRTMLLRKQGLAAKGSLRRLSNVESINAREKVASKPQEDNDNGNSNGNGSALKSKTQDKEARILQYLWLWTATIYLKLDLPEETEQCLVEAETAHKPSVLTFTYLGLLTSKTRKFLALQEFERSLEIFHLPEEQYNKPAYMLTLLGLCKLFIADDDKANSLFVSSKDLSAGLVRLKNYLEEQSHCWPYGYNSSELWYYLSGLYQKFDDKILYKQALLRCVELEDYRPVRSFDVCESFNTKFM